MDSSDLRAELAERLANSTAIDAETFNAACFVLSRALESLEFSVPEAAPLVRRLLRVAGRVIIDTAAADASPDVWPNTQDMAIQWIDEALRAKEAGEERVILFNLSGHGHFDMAAYDAYLAGELTDVVYEPVRANADGERLAVSEREPVTA